MIAELVCFLDIVLKFFCQSVDEEGFPKKEKLQTVAQNYLRGDFAQDLIVFLPIGLVSTYIDNRLKIFWIIKAFRIVKLNMFIGERYIEPIVTMRIKNLQLRALKDENLRSNTSQDHIYNTEKIFFMNIIKLLRLVIQITFVAFYIGQYWFIFCLTIY